MLLNLESADDIRKMKKMQIQIESDSEDVKKD